MKVNQAKKQIQEDARTEIDKNNGTGLVEIATGGGKTKIAIDYISDNNLKAIWFTPSVVMRDVDTPAEFKKWGKEKYFKEKVEIYCYASMPKLHDLDADIIILDEVHKVTELRSEFFFENNNSFSKVLAFTATKPDDEQKIDIFNRLGIKTLYKLSVDDAVEKGVIAPYKLVVVRVPLSEKLRVRAGSKGKEYLITEHKWYSNLKRVIASIMAEGKEIPPSLFMRRANFLYNLKSKIVITKAIIDSHPDDRILIFSKRKVVAKEINKNVYHSTSGKKALENFIAKNSRILSVVDSINEGVNIPDVDVIILHQINSIDREFIQKIGRGLRFRKGYTALIYLVVSEDTRDEQWVGKAIQSIGEENISYKSYKDYVKEI